MCMYVCLSAIESLIVIYVSLNIGFERAELVFVHVCV